MPAPLKDYPSAIVDYYGRSQGALYALGGHDGAGLAAPKRDTLTHPGAWALEDGMQEEDSSLTLADAYQAAEKLMKELTGYLTSELDIPSSDSSSSDKAERMRGLQSRRRSVVVR